MTLSHTATRTGFDCFVPGGDLRCLALGQTARRSPRSAVLGTSSSVASGSDGRTPWHPGTGALGEKKGLTRMPSLPAECWGAYPEFPCAPHMCV